MANHTRAQRYNASMDKIFEDAKVLNAKHDAGRARHAEEKHGNEYSSCKTCHQADDKKRELAKKVK